MSWGRSGLKRTHVHPGGRRPPGSLEVQVRITATYRYTDRAFARQTLTLDETVTVPLGKLELGP